MSVVRFCDLDGTLIHSYRECLNDGVLVERYNGKPLSYMSRRAYESIQVIPRNLLIPVTSRTKEQYNRISLYKDGGVPKYALLDNGGILLIDGKEDVQWKHEIQQYIWAELSRYKRITYEISKYGETKIQDELVIFVKPFSDREKVLLQEYVKTCEGMQLFQHGNKLYVCSDKLTKGYAVGKLIKKYSIHNAIAAGDSIVDLTMIDHVSYGFFSKELETNVSEEYLHKIEFVDKVHLAESVLNYEL